MTATARQHTTNKPKPVEELVKTPCQMPQNLQYYKSQRNSTMRTITKVQALEQFRYNWMVSGSTDKVAKREAWGIFTDELCREGYITMKKYESWSNPF